MARNSLAGTKKGKSKTAKYYQDNPEAKKKKAAYDKKYNKTPTQLKKRAETAKANRRAGTYGNGDGKDASHTKSGKIVMEKQSANRARNGAKKGVKKSTKRKNTKK